MQSSVKAWIDGASRGNPGPAGMGVVVKDENGEKISEVSEYLGSELTNNQAEYKALLSALELCDELGVREVEVKSDSQLLVRQMKGEYKVRSKNLKDLYRKAIDLESKFQKIAYKHIPRADNATADRLAREATENRD